MSKDEELTEMETAAVMMHEMFLSCCKAGFSEDQAIKLLLGMMAANKPQFLPPQSPNGQGHLNN